MVNLSTPAVFARKTALLAIVLGAAIASRPALLAQASTEQSASTPSILGREQASAILPQSVFFHGQSASIQGRNSAGIRSGNKLVLATLVDTSGYSSAVQETYQAYLLAEVPLTLGSKHLAPGAYGFGFVNGSEMVVMDIGGDEILRVAIARDQALARPTPLQVLKNTAGDGFRLYLGRLYVVFAPAEK